MGAIAREMPQAWEGKPAKLWRAACGSYGVIWGIIGRTVVDECGQAGLEAIRKAFRQIARRQAKRAFESGRFERNARGMGQYMKFAEETLGMIVELAEATEKRAVFRWLKCPLYDDPVKESTPELCLAYDEFEMEAAKICHPKLTCTITKSMGRGDDCCEMVFQMQD